VEAAMWRGRRRRRRRREGGGREGGRGGVPGNCNNLDLT
jgi:hypothetical protein